MRCAPMNGTAALDIRPVWRYAVDKAASDSRCHLENRILFCSGLEVYTKFGGDPAIAVAVLLYFLLGRIMGSGEVGWVCILAAFPFAICGFFRYNGMYFEQFAWAFIRSELLYPRQLVYKSENLYVKALADGSLKEVLALD